MNKEFYNTTFILNSIPCIIYDEYTNCDLSFDNISIYVKKLNKNLIYHIDSKDNNILNNYIMDIVKWHINEKKMSEKKIKIEYSFIEYNENLSYEYEKKTNEKPLFSIISSFFDNNQFMLFTNIDDDVYKYKDFNNEHLFSIINPKKKNTHSF